MSREPGPRFAGARNTIMGLTPIVALVLFFTTGSWLWFLVIPVVGVLLFGPGRRRD